MMAYDAGNRKDVRALEKESKFENQQRMEVIKGIMSVPPGRKWMYDLLFRCHVFSTSYSDLGLRMSFMEGQREVAIWVLTDIMSACPDSYVEMMREANERQSAIDSRLSRKDAYGGDKGSGPDDGSGGDDAPDIYDDGNRYDYDRAEVDSER